MEIIPSQEMVLVPCTVVVCPECAGSLIALMDEFEQIVPGVNLYRSYKVGYSTCLFVKGHGIERNEDWERVDEAIDAWLQQGHVLAEL